MQIGDLFKVKQAWNTFRHNHPQFPGFLNDVNRKGLAPGTDITISVTFPDGEKKEAGLHVKPEDVQLLQMLQSM
ncbi:MAG: hypothetical protein IJS55_07520 [Oscillospiraceae bacterium]|nr:hypothetical protein [Oscillospiraceae bacterium]